MKARVRNMVGPPQAKEARGTPTPHPKPLPRPPPGPQAEAVLMLADALNIPKFNWLGWSSGGNTGALQRCCQGASVLTIPIRCH